MEYRRKSAVYWDVTKTGKRNYPASGMKKVSMRLLTEVEALGYEVHPVKWSRRNKKFFTDKLPVARDHRIPYICPEVYCEEERNGVIDWLDNYKGRKIAIFYDAIPKSHPEITWPHSVSRHPSYMTMLGNHFSTVVSISKSSQDELLKFWDTLNLQKLPNCQTMKLGSDLHFQLRAPLRKFSEKTSLWNLLMVGILEPRKNHVLALEACEKINREGIPLRLNIAGRLNPHFGGRILDKIQKAKRAGLDVIWHKSPNPTALVKIYREADLCLFPSIAEGCGLPVLESLWLGTPVLASDIPSVVENGELPGLKIFPLGKQDSLLENLRSIITKPEKLKKLQCDCQKANLPTWREAAASLMDKIS